MDESSKPSYWRDTDGIVHILDAQYHVMLCNGLYRLDQDRLEGEFPTCFLCIAADAPKRNGEPGVVRW